MFPANFGYLAAHSLAEALELLGRHGDDAKLLAGGHSLLPAMKLRLTSPRTLIDLGKISELAGVRSEGETLVIGATTVHADVASSDLIRKTLPGLAEAASVIGDVQVRNRGTIGGSIAHADPAADFPVILTALNAAFVLQSAGGARTLPVDEFFVDFFTTAMRQDEILTDVRVPVPRSGTGTAYAKLAHPASGYVVVSAGAMVTRDSSGRCAAVRIALGGLTGGPSRAKASEAALAGKELGIQDILGAAAKAADETDPDGDIYASADYKRHMATVLTRRALESAVRRTAG
jgi:aerobic carbon-monoxide dehydrogenase medium subunit